MSARVIRYYERDPNRLFGCRCGWRGPLSAMPRELCAELADHSCPACDAMLVIVPYPTLEETRQAAARGDPEGIAELARWDGRPGTSG